jgi:hypothetical protein
MIRQHVYALCYDFHALWTAVANPAPAMARAGASAIRHHLTSSTMSHSLLKESTRRGRTGSYFPGNVRFFFCSFAVSVRNTSVTSIKSPNRWKEKGSPVVFCYPFPMFSSRAKSIVAVKASVEDNQEHLEEHGEE